MFLEMSRQLIFNWRHNQFLFVKSQQILHEEDFFGCGFYQSFSNAIYRLSVERGKACLGDKHYSSNFWRETVLHGVPSGPIVPWDLPIKKDIHYTNGGKSDK